MHLCVCVAGCLAKLTATPNNTVATLGQKTDVVLSCKTDKSGIRLIWSFDSNTHVIFNGYDEEEKYPMAINHATGEFNITLRDFDSSYSGLYTCTEPGSQQRASAQLTILGMLIYIFFRDRL